MTPKPQEFTTYICNLCYNKVMISVVAEVVCLRCGFEMLPVDATSQPTFGTGAYPADADEVASAKEVIPLYG